MHIDELLTKESGLLKQEAVLDPLKDGISSLELVRISGSDLDVSVVVSSICTDLLLSLFVGQYILADIEILQTGHLSSTSF